MKFSRANWYDSTKDRRNGMFFLISLVAFFGVLILLKFASNIWADLGLEKSDLEVFLLFAPLGVFIFIFALIWREAHRERVPQKKSTERSEMSRDEILKARSKLMKAKTK